MQFHGRAEILELSAPGISQDPEHEGGEPKRQDCLDPGRDQPAMKQPQGRCQGADRRGNNVPPEEASGAQVGIASRALLPSTRRLIVLTTKSTNRLRNAAWPNWFEAGGTTCSALPRSKAPDSATTAPTPTRTLSTPDLVVFKQSSEAGSRLSSAVSAGSRIVDGTS